ncbi:MAG: bifunctional riboflavin kinase/FAD synthetase [Bacteroidales bacterium]|nr:bifunctional riboflavin kinase/FAD synthetase [Bacteroidales bacterium]
MKLFRNINEIDLPKCTAVTVGTYDGVHIGHRQVLNKLKETAERNHCQSVVVTFSPHPRIVLNQGKSDLKLIDTEEEKYEKIKQIGIDNLVVIPFNLEFSKLSYKEFVENILLRKLALKHFVFGKDHQLGHNRQGTSEAISELSQKYGFGISYVNTYDIKGIDVSSTKIRNALLSGDVKSANIMLGDYFCLTATVVEGMKVGRNIGFPTANLFVQDTNKILPGQGVYAVKVKYKDNFYQGMMNFGKKPTITSEDNLIPEVHIFDFSSYLYNETMQVFLIEKMRDEIRFENIDMLKQQLSKDKENALSILNANNRDNAIF